MIARRVFGIHDRDFLISNLIKNLDITYDDVIYDDRLNGGLPLYTMERAFRKPVSKDITHVLVSNDDMIFSDNAIDILERMVKAHPNAIINPFPYAIDKYGVDLPDNLLTPYIYSNALCGGVIIMPSEIIEDCFTWIHNVTKQKFDKTRDEYIIWKYALSHDIPVITTVPSVCQHIGDDYGTTLSYPVSVNRKTRWYFDHIDESIDWDSKDVIPFPGFDYKDIGSVLPLSDEFMIQSCMIQKQALQ